MFEFLKIERFKGWETSGLLRLAPITVFFGSNSSGKTSLLQSLLLLKQTADSHDRTRVLHTGDSKSLVDLGLLRDIAHQHDPTRPMRFMLGWKLEAPLAVPGHHPTSLKLDVTIRADAQGAAVVEQLRYHLDDATVTYARTSSGGYTLGGTGVTLDRRKGATAELPSPTHFYGLPTEATYAFQNADWLRDLAFEVEKQFARLHYVGPLREYPKRNYLWAGERPGDVGIKGEDAVPAILAARTSGLMIPRADGSHVAFESVIAEWLQKMSVIESFRVETVAEHRKDYEVKVTRAPGATEVLITDVGFGVSQLLPVLVQCYYAGPNETVLFEQPEIHLHPRVQADLADVAIDAAKQRGVQFLIESHSEHFLRRLQRRVAEEAIPAADVALYVCDVKDGKSSIEALKVDDFGNISNWPVDFFGDEMGDLSAMATAAMRRKKRGPK